MSQIFRPPIETVVTLRAKMLFSFVWEREIHFISGIGNIWLVETGWWGERPIRRVYFQVKTTRRKLVVIFRDTIAEIWYLEGQYD